MEIEEFFETIDLIKQKIQDYANCKNCNTKLFTENLMLKRKIEEMDKLIKKDKKKIDKMMTTLINKDIPRDKKLAKCDKKMRKR